MFRGANDAHVFSTDCRVNSHIKSLLRITYTELAGREIIMQAGLL